MNKHKTVIGVDPDSKAHGIAIYIHGQLSRLENWTLVDVMRYIKSEFEGAQEKPLFSIENVLANNFVYARNAKSSKAAHAKVSLSVGRCQQSQVELMRLLESYEIPYVLHKPMKGNWAKNKLQFQRLTGWPGRSNEETRSAAFFGYLAAR
jgi:hypothetical protein